MTGFRRWHYGEYVHAGLVVGWVHKPAATIVEHPFGAGRFVATTFRLMEDRATEDAVAATLLSALLELAAALPQPPVLADCNPMPLRTGEDR